VAIKGVLFDKDGTILDYWQTWVPINRKAALHVAGGNQALADELLRLGGHEPATDRVTPGTPLAAGDFEDIAGAFARHPAVRRTPELVASIERIFCEGGAAHSVLIEGARETLIELKRRGLYLGVATNDSEAGLEASLTPHVALDLFDFRAGCDSGYGAKPDPRMVLAFCKAARIARGEVAVVGDAVHDLAMGRAAGAGLNIGVLSGTSGRADLEDYADLIVESVNDLPGLSLFAGPAGDL
jgi:phosphoglycolate phosphatase